MLRRVAAHALWRTRLCKLMTIQRRGYRVRFHPSSFSAGLWVKPDWVSADERFIRDNVKSDDVVLDIGANIGTLTLTAASLGARVIAIEAHPRTYSFLLDNVALNGFQCISALNIAVGDKTGRTHFSDLRDDDNNHVSDIGIAVPMATIDSLNVPPIRLMKLDVEGYELRALQGAKETLKRTDCVYFESYDSHCRRFGYEAHDVFKLLSHAGFTITDLTGRAIGMDSNSPTCRNLVARRSY